MLVDLGDIIVNTDFIIEMTYEVPDVLVLAMRDGGTIRVDSSWKDDLLGRFHVVQVIPLTKPMYAHFYEPDGNLQAHEEIHYLGLCADGRIRGLEQTCTERGKEYTVIEDKCWNLYTDAECVESLRERKLKEAEQ